MMDSFLLVAYAGLAASITFLQQLLACLNFSLDSKDLFFGTNERIDFYELWKQHKLLKTTGMGEAEPDNYGEGYIHQFQLEPLNKIHKQQKKYWV